MKLPTTPGALHRAAMMLATAPKDSGSYAAALGVLAGVKLRKARIYCGLDGGQFSAAARVRLDAAKVRYDHVVPCVGASDVRSAVGAIGRCFIFGSYRMRSEVLPSMFGGPTFAVQENSAESAHGALAAQFKLPVAGVIAGALDPAALLHEFMAQRVLPAGYVGTIVVAVPHLEEVAAEDAWATLRHLVATAGKPGDLLATGPTAAAIAGALAMPVVNVNLALWGMWDAGLLVVSGPERATTFKASAKGHAIIAAMPPDLLR